MDAWQKRSRWCGARPRRTIMLRPFKVSLTCCAKRSRLSAIALAACQKHTRFQVAKERGGGGEV